MWELRGTILTAIGALSISYVAYANIKIARLQSEVAVKQSTVDVLRLNIANLTDALDNQNKMIEDQVSMIHDMDKEMETLKATINTISESSKCDIDKILKTKPELGKEVQHLREVAKKLK